METKNSQSAWSTVREAGCDGRIPQSSRQNVACKTQAKAVNLHLFRAIHPEHATIERPDKAKRSMARSDWRRSGDQLREGRRWLDIRDHLGGARAFLTLPPQCVSGRYLPKIPIEGCGSGSVCSMWHGER